MMDPLIITHKRIKRVDILDPQPGLVYSAWMDGDEPIVEVWRIGAGDDGATITLLGEEGLQVLDQLYRRISSVQRSVFVMQVLDVYRAALSESNDDHAEVSES